MTHGSVIPRADFNQRASGPRASHGFDFIHLEPVNASDLLKVPVSFTVFKVPANLGSAEITRLHVSGEPRGVWFSMVSWLPIVSGGGPQEILVGSNAPTITNAGVAIPTPSSTTRRSDGGLRYTTYGSMVDPLPVLIRMAPNQQFGIKILSVVNGSGSPRLKAMMVYVRAMGVFFRS